MHEPEERDGATSPLAPPLPSVGVSVVMERESVSKMTVSPTVPHPAAADELAFFVLLVASGQAHDTVRHPVE